MIKLLNSIKTIEVDPNYAEAYSNLGLIYCLQAQDFSEKATTDINDPKYKDQATLKTFYEKANLIMKRQEN